MAVTYIAARAITLSGHAYAAGDPINTTGWSANTISEMVRMGWLAISSGGGTGGPESDPVAMPAISTETSRAQGAEAAEIVARQNAVSAEQTRAQAAESANTTSISNETSARTSADTTETNRATAAEATKITAPASPADANALIYSAAATAWQAKAWSGVGTLAARPAANSVVPGYLYLATDDTGGTAYRSDGTNWTAIGAGVSQPSGVELGYANYTGASMTFTNPAADITGCSITFTVGVRPVYVHSYVTLATNSNASPAQIILQVTDAANTEKSRDLMAELPTAAVSPGHLETWERITAAGSYTRKMRMGNNNQGGTVTVYGSGSGTQFATFIRAVTA